MLLGAFGIGMAWLPYQLASTAQTCNPFGCSEHDWKEHRVDWQERRFDWGESRRRGQREYKRRDVIVYENENFDGRSQRFSPDIYRADQGDLSCIGNDTISSLSVPSGLVVRLCENENSGFCRVYGPGDYFYVGDDLNDKISLIDIQHL